MTFQQELSSWFYPRNTPIPSPIPHPGDRAPTTPLLNLQPNKPTLLTFLRHCGCPWAEKTYLAFRSTATSNPGIDFIAISHSSQTSTDKWLASLPPLANNASEPKNLRVIVDDGMEIYAAYGLGQASFLHVLDPRALWNVYQTGKREGIWNRPTESGSRWVISGSYGVDAEGVVRWGGPMGRADEIPEFGDAVEKVSGSGKVEAKL